MYYPSKYNHLMKLNTENGRTVRILSNLFFGSVDLVNETVYDAFIEGEKCGVISREDWKENVWKYFQERGFVWQDSESEENIIRSGARYYGQRDQIAAGLGGGYYGFITSLYCNLACPYCFQKNKADSCGFLSPKMVDKGLAAIENCETRVMSLNNGKETLPKISITGGEPLLRSEANLEVLDHLIGRLWDLHWPYSITTNGTELEQFIADHEPSENCRNIQVTLDGPREIHDRRRRFRNGAPSFDRIVKGLEGALEQGWKMTLRVNLDMGNVDYLPILAEFIKSRGWRNYKDFFAYASPVTDHGAIGGYDTPKDESDLLLSLLQVVEKSPIVREVFDIRHFRGFDYVERMLVKKNPRYPSIYRCEAVLGMYIFDPMGDIHVCLEAAGDPALRVGTYYPDWHLDKLAAEKWTQRHVLSMDECNNCKTRFICAGGCTMDGFNHGNEARCMPFLKEVEIAWQYYARNSPELFT